MSYGHGDAMSDAQSLYYWSCQSGYCLAGRAAAERLTAYIEKLEAVVKESRDVRGTSDGEDESKELASALLDLDYFCEGDVE